jgi:protein SCO1/2
MNKKHSYIGVSFIILLFGIYVVRNIDRRVHQNDLIQDDRLHKVENKTGSMNNLFKFNKVPVFEFTNQNNIQITTTDFKDKVYVVEFFFTTCPTICPIMNSKMLALQNEFIENSNFGIASISITPEFDTPKVLKEYADRQGAKHKNWHFLTGKSEEIVYDLSNKGFKLYAGKGDENHGGFEHSGLFALIDKDGYIRSRMDAFGNPIMYYRAIEEQGFSDQIKELKEDIKILLNE